MNPDTEHLTFQSMTEHLSAATADARRMAAFRPDQPWIKVAEKLEELTGMLFSMVGDGHVKGFKQ